MSGLYLYTSNSLEHLALVLSDWVRKSLDPMTPEIILVQSGGMQRWLSMQLARELGVWANARFPFPVGFAYELCRDFLPDLPKEYALSKDNMLWRIVRILPGLLDEPGFRLPRAYLKDDSTFKLIQLAEKIAFHFDQYQIFRPHWARQWEQRLPGGEFRQEAHLEAETWQARLWREVVAGHEQEHRAALLGRLMDLLRRPEPPKSLPERISLFGISTLPPAYLDLFAELGRHIDVRVFLLSPCSHFWADLPGRRERLLEYRSIAAGGTSQDEGGDSLLAELGTLGRDFQGLLLDAGIDELPLYRPIDAPASLLEHVQRDLLELPQDREAPVRIDLKDDSIQVHCCHSPMREMEIVRDLILDRLQKDGTLQPRDILVMNPDIETYAPFIQAVFGNPEDPTSFLAYSISDRRPSRAAQSVRLFLELLEFGQHRFEASRVLALLESPAVCKVLDLDETESTRIGEWVRETGIRWGADTSFRKESGLADYGQNTWESGLARLFLGYMTGPAHEPLGGVAPFGPLGSSDQDLMGRLAGFIDRLHTLWSRLNSPGKAEDWKKTLHGILDDFFPQDRDTAESILSIRNAIAELTNAVAANSSDLLLDCRAMLHLMRARLDETKAESGFMASGLTFCGLRPMRAIPFRVIFLTGLSSTAFPRQEPGCGFDLMAASPKKGDRSLREDDRYLFLESLISARDALVMTYPGLSQADNSKAPPSVLVSELLDHLDRRFLVQDSRPSKSLCVWHRLQGFHPDYFRPSQDIFSFSGQNCQASRALCQPPVDGPLFAAGAEGVAADGDVDIEDLIRFLCHPVKNLMRNLGMEPAQPEEEAPDEEPLAPPSGLEAYSLSEELLSRYLDDRETRLESLLAARQVLPPGPAGRDACQEVCAQIREMGELVLSERGENEAELLDMSIDLGSRKLTGRVALYEGRVITWRPAKLNGKDLLRLWVRHLGLRAMGRDAQSVHVAKDTIFHAPQTDRTQAAELLRTLTDLYAQGMSSPVALFPKSSHAYALKRYENPQTSPDEARELALDKAQDTWLGDQRTVGECEEQYLAVAFRDRDPDWEEFAAIAETVYGPILENSHDA